MTVKEARERIGKTQSEMAEILGISRNYLALIETGKRPESPDILQRALLIVNKQSKDISKEEWRSRALAAEAKLDNLKKAMLTWIEQF